MFKTIKAGLAAVILMAATMPGAALASGRGFVVVNQNGKVSVQRVWYAAAGTKQPWKEVFLDYPIKPKTSSNFTMPEGSICLYDVKIQFSDTYTQSFANINVCRFDKAMAT
ncbi:hypothetical protein [uncultured Sphingomonas sp.]|uniref:hypothetical protein n=1 Tax=uncultured Sphingomonas sp. TaxID=158754 RepID=UPI0035C99471